MKTLSKAIRAEKKEHGDLTALYTFNQKLKKDRH
jgi:hypothetical protein